MPSSALIFRALRAPLKHCELGLACVVHPAKEIDTSDQQEIDTSNALALRVNALSYSQVFEACFFSFPAPL